MTDKKHHSVSKEDLDKLEDHCDCNKCSDWEKFKEKCRFHWPNKKKCSMKI
jgi:hypothetical protein